jgi:hypothetical protein
MGGAAQARRAPHVLDLLGALDQAQLMQVVVRLDELDRRARAQRVEQLEHALVVVLIEAARPDDAFLAGQEVRQVLPQLLDRPRLVDAEGRGRGLEAQAATVPDLALGIALAQEEDRAPEASIRPRAPRRRQEHQHRLRLIESGQVPEIARGPEAVVAIVIADLVHRGRDHRRAALGTQELQESTAVLAVHRGQPTVLVQKLHLL